MSNAILSVIRVSKEAGDYIVKCPHCKSIIGIEGNDLSEIRGEQYNHRACGGWLEVSHDARFARELDLNEKSCCESRYPDDLVESDGGEA